MTKFELFKEYQNLLEQKGISKLYNININSTKKVIKHAIDCLKCSDEQLDKYLMCVKSDYPNIYNIIVKSGDYKSHPYLRFYVYNTIKNINILLS